MIRSRRSPEAVNHVGISERRAPAGPLADLDDWESAHALPRPGGRAGRRLEFRDYRAEVRPGVREFYRQNHTPPDARLRPGEEARSTCREAQRTMGIWEAMEFLNTLVDDSDPDTDLSQIEHLMQTAEAIRRDGHPRWFILTGLIHDLGKVLCLFGEPQWAVVGDTFPVGCALLRPDRLPRVLRRQPRRHRARVPDALRHLRGRLRARRVHLSWGHDEYLYHVVKDYLPEEGLA